jgi:protein HOOK3
MPPYSPSAQAALLKTANCLFRLDRDVESFDQLTSGIVLGAILDQLDSNFDLSDLDTQGIPKHVPNKRNLEIVHKRLFQFLRRQIPQLWHQAKKVDLRSFADHPDAQSLSHVLAVMVSAATLGSDASKYIPRIQGGLDRDSQGEIMQILRVVQEEISASPDEEHLDSVDTVEDSRDIDLVLEEQNAALQRKLDITQKTLSDYITRLEHLQLSHDELQYEKEKSDRELEVLRKATQDGASSAESVKVLEYQVHEQMEIIARNEDTIREHEKTRDLLQAEVKRLTKQTMDIEELRDEVAEWKHRAEDLEKKANAAVRYKSKLESQQHLETEVENLKYERRGMQEELRALREQVKRFESTRKADEELSKLIAQSEQHLWDERSQKNQLFQEITSMKEEVERLTEQRKHDEGFIRGLQEQLQEGGGGGFGAGTPMGDPSNLEDELMNASNEDSFPKFNLELSRVKAENQHLRDTMGSTADAALVRRELDDQKDKTERVTRNYQDMFEKNTVAQSQIDALTANATGEGTKVFEELRTENTGLLAKLEEAQKRIADLENQNADQVREILSLKTDLSAVGKDQLEALEDLKNTDALIAKSVQAELDRVRAKLQATTEERDMHKSQLVEVILAKEQLSKLAQDGKATEAAEKDTDAVEGRKSQAEKIEKLRERLVERNKVSPVTDSHTSYAPYMPLKPVLPHAMLRPPEPAKPPLRGAVYRASYPRDGVHNRPPLYKPRPKFAFQSAMNSPSQRSAEWSTISPPSGRQSEEWVKVPSLIPTSDMRPKSKKPSGSFISRFFRGRNS